MPPSWYNYMMRSAFAAPGQPCSERPCAHCGTMLRLRLYYAKTHRYAFCGRECQTAAWPALHTGEGNGRFGKRKGEQRQCATCGKSFYAYPSQASKRYCSHKCKGSATRNRWAGVARTPESRAHQSAVMAGRVIPGRRKPPVEKTCEGCGKSFVLSPTQHRGKAREQRRFCSTDCWYIFIRANPEAHGAFRGGYEPYYGPDWPYQARLARERDGHTCQHCGKQQKRPLLDVHHLVPRRSFNGDHERANRQENLITLCKACHTIAESVLTKTIRRATS
jgi:5-methylcytosine-specific restriction endonuclease McrA